MIISKQLFLSKSHVIHVKMTFLWDVYTSNDVSTVKYTWALNLQKTGFSYTFSQNPIIVYGSLK